MSLPTEQHFILKEDGKICWIEKMPDEVAYDEMGLNYEQEVKRSIDSAVEVSNQKIVHGELFDKYDCNLEPGAVYSLLCSVEKKSMKYKGSNNGNYMVGVKPFALVTFSKPEEKQRYICLNCKAVHNFEPEKCPCCGRKTFHKTETHPSEGIEPEEKETQEEDQDLLWDEVHDRLAGRPNLTFDDFETIRRDFTITRKK